MVAVNKVEFNKGSKGSRKLIVMLILFAVLQLSLRFFQWIRIDSSYTSSYSKSNLLKEMELLKHKHEESEKQIKDLKSNLREAKEDLVAAKALQINVKSLASSMKETQQDYVQRLDSQFAAQEKEAETNIKQHSEYNKIQASLSLPPVCAQPELDAIAADDWENTNCPISTWLTNYFQNPGKPISDSFTALWLGCNKAYDAVDALRMGSGNPAVDKDKWYQHMSLTYGAEKGACRQGLDTQFQIKRNHIIPGQLICVEALPTNVKALLETNAALGYEQYGLEVYHAAISNQDGTVKFPAASKSIGKENMGIWTCDVKPDECEDVPALTVDTLAIERIDSSTIIDILSVDIEGFDIWALHGAAETLNRVVYLEFEYHKVGQWREHELEEAIDMLSEEYNFVCYWAGKGKLWRISGCWIDDFNKKHWSNVACINYNLPQSEELAEDMEDLYHATVEMAPSHANG